MRAAMTGAELMEAVVQMLSELNDGSHMLYAALTVSVVAVFSLLFAVAMDLLSRAAGWDTSAQKHTQSKAGE